MVDDKSDKQDKQPLLVVNDKHCGEWSQKWGEGCSHHASFGANGTTASISRYGDVMQVTQYLGKGSSGIVSMDHTEVPEPWFVASRAQKLQSLSMSSSYGAYTFGIFMDYWPTEGIPSVKWLNWKWPRYEWEEDDMHIIFQYMVHEGIVLQQLLFQNQGKESKPLDNLILDGDLEISDLDYLRIPYEPAFEFLVRNIPGPHGYGRVTIKSLQAEISQQGNPGESQEAPNPGEAHVPTNSEQDEVVSLMDIFIDGERTPIPNDKPYELGTVEPGKVKEIVVAYKLSVHSRGSISWEDLMINAEHTNVSKFLNQELESLGDEGIRADSLHLNLQPVDNAAKAERKGEDASLKTVIANEELIEKPRGESARVIPAFSGQSKDHFGIAETDKS